MAEPAAPDGLGLPLAWRAPVACLAHIADEPGALLLSGGDASSRGRFSYLTGFPREIINAPGDDDP